MAWRNVPQAISASIPQNIISDPDSFITAYNNASTPQQKEQAYANYVFPTWNGADTRDIVTERLLGDNTNYCNITASGSSYSFTCFYNGSQINFSQGDFKSADYTACYVALANEETQTGFFCGFIRYRQNQACGAMGGTVPTTSGTISQQIYTILTANEYHQYTWSSVPAISGKNGILSLTQILNINDGEPVEDVTNKGNLDFSKKTKVNTLVNNNYEPTYKEDQTKATVSYEIPEAEYQYTKLVYKKKKIPKSASDGTAINIGADDTEVFVSGLEENTTYYFVIFTNRTKSNAYKFKTGKNDAPEGIFKMRITTTQGVKDSGFKEVIEVTRV